MENPAAEPCRETAPARLCLLGGFELRDANGIAGSLPTRKAQLLLAYLALPAGLAHAREKLAGLFWGERQDEQARGSLRNALAAIRAALGPDALGSERDSVELVPGVLELDVDRLAAAASGDGPACDDLLGLALRSELLEGLAAPSEGFAEWLAFERMRCRGLATTAAQKAIAANERAGRFAAAVELAQRLVALDPLREHSQRLLIQAYLAAGERSRAMVQLQSCRELLSRELGVQPSAETMALADLAAREGTIALPPTMAHPSGPVPEAASAPASFSVAVLPFLNLSGDPEQNFLAEGFSEDLITELSRRRDFSVIARQSSYLFSGRPETASAAAAELSARYALTGSLRRAGERLRVTAQLLDAAGNRCIWAQRYDRSVADIFAMQDEIVASILDSIDAEVRSDERERAARKLPRELDAWELFHRGLWHVYRFTREDVASGEALFRQALARAPDFALPHAGLGYAAFVGAVWYFAPDPRLAVMEGIGHARTAVSLDGGNAFARFALGRLLTLAGEIEQALHQLSQAVELNPSFAQAHFGLGQALTYAGRPQEALASIERALALSPKDPLTSMFLTVRAFCHYSLGDYRQAEAAARVATQLQMRETWSRLALAVALVELGRVEEAKRAVAEARRVEPTLSLESFGRLVGPVAPALRERVWAGLRAAGIDAQP